MLRLADFGLATVVPEAGGEGAGSSALLYSYCGSNAYMAPEVYASQSYEGTHADLWSAACGAFSCCCCYCWVSMITDESPVCGIVLQCCS